MPTDLYELYGYPLQEDEFMPQRQNPELDERKALLTDAYRANGDKYGSGLLSNDVMTGDAWRGDYYEYLLEQGLSPEEAEQAINAAAEETYSREGSVPHRVDIIQRLLDFLRTPGEDYGYDLSDPQTHNDYGFDGRTGRRLDEPRTPGNPDNIGNMDAGKRYGNDFGAYEGEDYFPPEYYAPEEQYAKGGAVKPPAQGHIEQNYGRLMNDPEILDALGRISEAGYDRSLSVESLLDDLIVDLQNNQLDDSGDHQSEFIREATNDHMGFRMPSERSDQFWTDSGSEAWYRMLDRLERFPPDYMYDQIDRGRGRAFELYYPDYDRSRYEDDYNWAPRPKGEYATGGRVKKDLANTDPLYGDWYYRKGDAMFDSHGNDFAGPRNELGSAEQYLRDWNNRISGSPELQARSLRDIEQRVYEDGRKRGLSDRAIQEVLRELQYGFYD